jgi:NADH:ubiquinone oxidoreductase subunit 3 (subunit A)
MAESWGFVAVFLVIALSIPLIGVLAAALLRPHRPGPIKRSTYECGLGTEGDSWVQYKVQYYLYALVFVLFDVETVFVYPWAVAYNRLGLFAFVEMMIFLGILALGLVYAWRKGALEWI